MRQFAIEVLSVPYEYAKESVEAYDGNRRQSDEYRLTPGLAKKLSIKRRTEEKSHTTLYNNHTNKQTNKQTIKQSNRKNLHEL